MMKSNHSSKNLSSSLSMKTKKNSKDGEKRKSSSQESEKLPTSKDVKRYASISNESISTYIEQMTFEEEAPMVVSREIYDVLKEDINYKLRHILETALVKVKMCGSNSINPKHIEETFQHLSVDKVCGATSNPNWVSLGDQNVLYLDDYKINLIDIAEEEVTYAQYGNITLSKKWYSKEEPNQNPILKKYFTTMCCAIVNNNIYVRQTALKDISQNPKIGPIIEWFYHFGYFLLMKDVTYDSLTLYALDLIETLENSPLGNTTVSVKQLKLLVRLLLQRLLIAFVSTDVLKPMCSTLALLCLRESLKQMVITKINQKLKTTEVLPILTAVYYLGIDAVRAVFLPNLQYFVNKADLDSPSVVSILQAIYELVCKADSLNSPATLIPSDFPKKEIDFISMKTQLIKTRRKVYYNMVRKPKIELEQVFNIPQHDCIVRNKILQHRNSFRSYKKETHVIVGKTCLLLSELNRPDRYKSRCTGHMLP